MRKLYCEKCGCPLKRSAACPNAKCGHINYQLTGEIKKRNSVRIGIGAGLLAAGAAVIVMAVVFPSMMGQAGAKRDIDAVRAYVEINYPGAQLAEELYSPNFLRVSGDNGGRFSLDGVEFTVMASGGEVVSDDHDIAVVLADVRKNIVEPFFGDSPAQITIENDCQHLEPGFVHDVRLPLEKVRCRVTLPLGEGDTQPWEDYPMYDFSKAWADSGLSYYCVDIMFKNDPSDTKGYWWAQFSDHYLVESAGDMSDRFDFMGG